MVTLYVDIYFLINFTVDLLSIFFSAKLTKIVPKTLSMVLAAAIGAMQAVIYVLFFEDYIFGLIFSVLYFSFLSLYICRTLSLTRKIKFTAAFCVLQILIGGAVYFFYSMLDKYFDFSGDGVGTENRNLLILSLMILLSIGVLKLAINILSSAKSEKSARLLVEFEEKTVEVDCFVDSGNLACDPIDKTPAVFLTPRTFKKIFGINKLPNERFNNMLRIIPVKRKKNTEIYYGIKHEAVYLISKNAKEKARLILVIGNEESYAGFEALIPSSVL